jgi:hypothetical protein
MLFLNLNKFECRREKSSSRGFDGANADKLNKPNGTPVVVKMI